MKEPSTKQQRILDYIRDFIEEHDYPPSIRQIQEARKTSGFDVADRITVTWAAEAELRDAIAAHSGTISSEVLATSMSESDLSAHAGTDVFVDDDSGLRFTVTKN